MELDVTQALMKPGEEFPFEATVTLSPQDVNSDTVVFDPVTLKGMYSAVDGSVQLEGRLQSTAHAPCAVCLGNVDYPMDVTFAETFRKDAVETEDEAFRYEGSVVSLDHLSLTLLMLNLPMRFLCKGAHKDNKAYQAYSNLSKNSCQEDTQRPFEALKQLLQEDEEV
ncbi:MAG TPA: DUF177 domain-containing protein [Candidatus Limiplasma sp.]|nr:DUF177 domain-containing protein [Candidatus Limiplasma sp.]